MPLPKDPAELEARLLSAIEALRRIQFALEACKEPAVNPRAIAVLCASYAESVVDEVTS